MIQKSRFPILAVRWHSISMLFAVVFAAMAFTLSCSSENGDEHTYYAASYGINNVAECERMNAMLIGNNSIMTESDWEGVGYSFTDVKGVWDSYRVSNLGRLLSTSSKLTEGEVRNKILSYQDLQLLTPQELNAYFRGLNNRGNQLTVLFSDEFSASPDVCFVILYVEKE